LKFSESWRLAGTISTEVRFQAFLEANPSNLARVKENPQKIARSIRSSSRISGVMSGFILGMIAIIAVAASGFDAEIGSPDARLAVGFAVYLTLSFVVIFFLNLTTTSGLFSSGAMRLPALLPLSRADLEQLSFVTFIRIFAAPVILCVTIFPLLSLLVFGPLVALVAVAASASTAAIAIGSLVKVSKWFHKKSHSSDESRLSTFVRIAASMGIVIGMISVYSLGSYLPDLMRFVIGLSTTVGPQVFTVLSVIFPFSFGFLAASVAFGTSLDVAVGSVLGSAFYGIAAIIAYRRSGSSLRDVTLGGVSTARLAPLREIGLNIVTPLKAIIRKDLKLATRNIGSAFVFAIPIFLVVMLFPMIQYWDYGASGMMRSYPALVAIEYANLFGGISIVSVLMFDTQGASIQEGVPLSTMSVLRAKAVIAFVPYVLSMVALDVVFAIQPPISPLILLLPIIQIPVGYVLAMGVGAFVFRWRGGGRAVAVNVTSDQAAGLASAMVAAVIGIVPLVAYGTAMIFTGLHVISLAAQAALVAGEVLIVSRVVPRILKD
jgi:hypothetical protein